MRTIEKYKRILRDAAFLVYNHYERVATNPKISWDPLEGVCCSIMAACQQHYGNNKHRYKANRILRVYFRSLFFQDSPYGDQAFWMGPVIERLNDYSPRSNKTDEANRHRVIAILTAAELITERDIQNTSLGDTLLNSIGFDDI